MENNDIIKKYLACEGRVNVICAETTSLVEKARKTHDLSPVTTAALGRMLTMAVIMGSNLKSEDDSITLQIKGDGEIGLMTCVVDNKPNVKGYVSNPFVNIPLNKSGKLDVGTAVGKNGYLNVIKDIGLKEPYNSIIPLVSGEIAEDFTKYFAESEQTPSVVALGVLVDKNGVKKAGGYFITLMPDATEEDIKQIENAMEKSEPITTMLDKNMTIRQIAETITLDENLMVLPKEILPRFECNCSKEKFSRALMSIGKNELENILKEDGKAETICHFCNSKYQFSKEDIERLIIKCQEK